MSKDAATAALSWAALETEARRLKATLMVLNAGDNAIEFYRKHGNGAVGEADTAFRSVQHVKMAKTLA
jgi:predicted GNAT family N-acyltransferase